MDTSSSAEPAIAGADIFSGRPNPRWPFSSSQLERLESIWKRLPLRHDVAPEPAPLGYRGCFVDAGERRWIIFGSYVTLERNRLVESRSDMSHEIERLVLDSAPHTIAALLESAAIEPK